MLVKKFVNLKENTCFTAPHHKIIPFERGMCVVFGGGGGRGKIEMGDGLLFKTK